MRSGGLTARDVRAFGLAMLVPIGLLTTVVVRLVMGSIADKQSAPYLSSPNFLPLRGCPTRLTLHADVQKRCQDPRYLIRTSPIRYGLPMIGKRATVWLRVGHDAGLLSCGWGRSCYVVQVIKNVF